MTMNGNHDTGNHDTSTRAQFFLCRTALPVLYC